MKWFEKFLLLGRKWIMIKSYKKDMVNKVKYFLCYVWKNFSLVGNIYYLIDFKDYVNLFNFRYLDRVFSFYFRVKWIIYIIVVLYKD